ncbi:hypothetical protein OL229_15015 [Neisseriaceae bacterium JH1-16]|nr:hypothetical protein [Neisseriaceae bacterium JH1-16]
MLSDKEDTLQARDYQRLAPAVLAVPPMQSGHDRHRRFARSAGAGPLHFAPLPTLAATHLAPVCVDTWPPHPGHSVTLAAPTVGACSRAGTGLRRGGHATRFDPSVITASERDVALTTWVDDAIPPPLRVTQRWPNAEWLAGPAVAAIPLAPLIPGQRVGRTAGMPGTVHRGIGRPAALLGWKTAAADRLAAFATEDA